MNQTNQTILNIEEIKKILPHRYPFLLVDRVLEIKTNFARGVKNVTANEPFFQGHFPEEAVMPGVLQVEALAQLAAIYKSYNSEKDPSSFLFYLLTIDKIKFRKKVVPGDVLSLEVEILKDTGTKMVCIGKCSVDGAVVSEAEIMGMSSHKK